MNLKYYRLWWFLGSLLGLLCICLIFAAYWFKWLGSGFPGKTVWDWLQLLIIPLALAVIAVIFNQINTNTERQIAQEKQREDFLQSYLDSMSEMFVI